MAADRTLIQIRERSFLDVLDLALVVVRSRPKAIALAAVVGVAPCVVLNAWLMTDPEFLLPYYLAILAVEAPWATAPLTVVLGGLMFGQRQSVGQVVRALARGLPAMLLYQLFIRAFLVVIFILYPIIPGKLAFLNEVILLERGKVRGVVTRSSTLTGNRGGDFFGQWLAQLAFGGLFVLCFWMGTGAVISALTTAEVTWEEPGWGDLGGLRLQCAVWTTIVFFSVARFFTYIDQRIRLEGWEIKLRLQAVGRTLEEASRW